MQDHTPWPDSIIRNHQQPKAESKTGSPTLTIMTPWASRASKLYFFLARDHLSSTTCQLWLPWALTSFHPMTFSISSTRKPWPFLPFAHYILHFKPLQFCPPPFILVSSLSSPFQSFTPNKTHHLFSVLPFQPLTFFRSYSFLCST